ncbi:MAG: DUF6056 family protein [Bacteroidales bacterium]|nr:DUF6056 family protein [Bacteroidales bacterium]
MKKQPLLFLLFILSLVGFFLLNRYTNIAIDDFAYKNIFTPDAAEGGHRVQNMSDLFLSMYNHYFITNGRLLVNGLAQLFLMSDNKLWFDIANTIVFGLFQILIFALIGIKRKEITITSYLALLTMCWFLLPGPNHTLLWLDGSLNYLWASVLVMSFLYVHQQIAPRENQMKGIWMPILFLLGFLAGGTHEVISLGVSGALFFYYIFNLKSFKGALIPLIIGFFLGTLFVVLAPGNMVRVHSGGPGEATAALSVAQRLWGFTTSAPSMIPVVLLLIVLLFQFWKKRMTFKSTMANNTILLLSIGLSLSFILVVGAYQERVFFGVSLFSIIILLSLIHKADFPFVKNGIPFAIVIFTGMMLFNYLSVSSDLKANKTVFDQDEMTWRSSKDNVFELRNKKMNRFVSTGLGGMDSNFWSNKVMSWYYGKEYMVFIPSEIYQNTYKTNKIEDKNNQIAFSDSTKRTFYLSPKSRFIVLPITEKDSLDLSVSHIVTYQSIEPIPCRNLDIRQRVVKRLYGTVPPATNSEKSTVYCLETSHGKYLYFKAPLIIPMDKLKSIRIE